MKRMSGVLAGLRIYLGLIFLIAVWPKLTQPGFLGRMTGFLEHFALEQAHPFYKSFVEATVLPHAGTFALLVMVAEIAVGLMLVFGVATRAAATVAMFLLLNYMFAKGAWPWTPSSNDAPFLMIALATAIVGSGRYLGVDARLAQRWPGVPLW